MHEKDKKNPHYKLITNELLLYFDAHEAKKQVFYNKMYNKTVGARVNWQRKNE